MDLARKKLFQCFVHLNCHVFKKSWTINNCTDAKTRVGLTLVQQSCNMNLAALSAKGPGFPETPNGSPQNSPLMEVHKGTPALPSSSIHLLGALSEASW